MYTNVLYSIRYVWQTYRIGARRVRPVFSGSLGVDVFMRLSVYTGCNKFDNLFDTVATATVGGAPTATATTTLSTLARLGAKTQRSKARKHGGSDMQSGSTTTTTTTTSLTTAALGDCGANLMCMCLCAANVVVVAVDADVRSIIYGTA